MNKTSYVISAKVIGRYKSRRGLLFVPLEVASLSGLVACFQLNVFFSFYEVGGRG